ncbi:hypothetical protein FRUB_05437 [Fimbriiglobus ruber]|uniref:Uncharacterized protein n=1 Tax=Fimbriiglobus ruber TaxID=1908690 RepID=A0A225DPJ8_9BACT|nr:hypothetical protein FRUB_05437 [Fimbriiglobus ruber]
MPLVDTEACAAVRATLPPPGEYLGGAVMQVWVRDGAGGPELHDVYWVQLGEENEPMSRWGPQIFVRPVPSQYDIY